MLKRLFLFFGFTLRFLCSFATPAVAQENSPPRINVTVDLVQLNVAVTDNKGKYVTGLRPQDFVVTEDGIPESIATVWRRQRIRARRAECVAVRR